MKPKIANQSAVGGCSESAGSEIIRNLLRSSDCGWYQRNEGHDWREAVDAAEKYLKGRRLSVVIMRRLKSTEIIRRGDEWWDERDKTWYPTTSYSWGCDACGFKVRRKVTASLKPSNKNLTQDARP